ncbi:hypothetical protein PR048_007227 [Dryococelus australis]|uniref:Uncharacterized protein n=1 Tax=Dryococelus australis TaxID=614101 RepID=A0ABQ9IE95_9NEOP|nr:hypothetical protein PR048_007227 [Dryococelus australis]
MCNFDYQAQTISGIGGSHDTVLVVFQNVTENVMGCDDSEHRRLEKKEKLFFHSLLPCQELKYFKKQALRGEINNDFVVAQKPDHILPSSSEREQDMVWTLCRYHTSLHNVPEECDIPTWSAFNSILSSVDIPQMTTAFTPILPHPATEFSAIYTCMKNYQDCLAIVNQNTGSLCAYVGVNRIAQEIQLLRPEEFSKLFLGLGGFHSSKEFMTCLGKYLAGCGFGNILIETETFGPNVMDIVLAGKHYSCAMRGFSMLAVALERLLLKVFLENNTVPEHKTTEISELTACTKAKEMGEIRTHAKTLKYLIPGVMRKIDKFCEGQCTDNETFRYWEKEAVVLHDITKHEKVQIAQVLRDLSVKTPVEYGEPHDSTTFPVDTVAFWASPKNKQSLQSYFIHWLSQKEYSANSSSFIIYPGRVLQEARGRCLNIRNGIIKENLSLASHHDEADERILTHISHVTLTSNVSNVVICSTDTEVTVSALYHYHVTWKNAGLQELLVAFGLGRAMRYIPLHSLVTEIRVSHTVLISLPVVHSLTRCDTAIQQTNSGYTSHLLHVHLLSGGASVVDLTKKLPNSPLEALASLAFCTQTERKKLHFIIALTIVALRVVWLSEEIWTALDIEVLTADEGDSRCVRGSARMKGRGKRDITEKIPPINGTIQHDSPHAKIRECPAGDGTRFALVGGERANHSATAAPLRVEWYSVRVTGAPNDSHSRHFLSRVPNSNCPTSSIHDGQQRCKRTSSCLDTHAQKPRAVIFIDV